MADRTATCLALILLLHQLPRNMFRNSPQAYATDAAALELASEAVARGYSVPCASSAVLHLCAVPARESLADQETEIRLCTATTGAPRQGGLC